MNRREFLAPTNIVEQPDHSGIVLPDPNFGIEAQIQASHKQAEMLASAADFMDANPQMPRRSFLKAALFGAGKTVEAQQGFKNDVEYLGYPQHLIDRLGNFWYNPLKTEQRPYNDILFSGNIPVFTGSSRAHSCLVEDAYGRPMLAAGSHVMEMAIENGGSMYSYIPWAGFYEWKLDYLYKTKTYTNDSGDYGIWFLPLEGVATKNVNYLVAQRKLKKLRFVDSGPEQGDFYAMYYRPDVDGGKRVYCSAKSDGHNVFSYSIDSGGKPDREMAASCKGHSGSALFEINQTSYDPTGRVLGVLTRGSIDERDVYDRFNHCGYDNVHRIMPSNEDGYIETVYVK